MPTSKKSKPFSVRLREAREQIPAALGRSKRFTQAEMGEILGCASNHVARLEAERSAPSATIELCLAYALALVAQGVDPRVVK